MYVYFLGKKNGAQKKKKKTALEYKWDELVQTVT